MRINLHGFKYMDRDNRIDPKVLDRLDWVIEQSVKHDLVPVVDEHDFNECQRHPASCGIKLLDFWTQLSDRYAGRFPSLVFDILNEPGGQMTQEQWNALVPLLMSTIRAKNPHRALIVAAINSDDPHEVGRLLPADDRNIIVAVHYYKPIQFTHQGAEWSWKFAYVTGINWGSESDKRLVTSDFDVIDAWARKERRPIYLGEFSVYERAEIQARTRYLSFIARQAEQREWTWAYWQFDHDFALYDTGRDQWNLPILNALIPKPGSESRP